MWIQTNLIEEICVKNVSQDNLVEADIKSIPWEEFLLKHNVLNLNLYIYKLWTILSCGTLRMIFIL